MTQFSAPGFALGDQAWTREGVIGRITASRFVDEGDFWEHLLDTLPAAFIPEFDLLDVDPNIEAAAGPGEVVQVPPEEEEEVIVSPPPPLLPEITGDEERPEEELFSARQVEAIRLLVGDVLQLRGIEGAPAAQLDSVITTAVQQASLILDANLQALRQNVLEPLRSDLDTLGSQFLELESTVTTTLSEIENRRLALDAAAEGDEGGGLLGFFGTVGAIIRNPIDWFTSKILGFLIEEWKNGNSR